MSAPRTTKAELLAPVKRWTFVTKFWLCEGIRHHKITVAEAKHAHGLTDEELNRWYSRYVENGADGLRKINKNHRRVAA